jgi:EgtB-related family protein
MNAFEIDFRPISVSRYWEFVEHEGYLRRRFWSDEGWGWRQKSGAEGPLHFLKSQEGFQHRVGDHWQAIEPDAPAIHLSLFEAQAWCNWAGRRLPSEAEWMAAVDAGVEWGKVWEWTSSTFGPFPGFSPHPYQEYSKPWFKGHWVLKGASTMTNDLLRDPLLRNFYRPQRRDVFAGFRSVRAGN